MDNIYQNRINWTDEQWAKQLGCDVARIGPLRNWVRDNLFATICYNFSTKKWCFLIVQRLHSVNGDTHLYKWRSVENCDSRESAIEMGTRILIPNLQFGKYKAIGFGVPQNTPQLIQFMGKTR